MLKNNYPKELGNATNITSTTEKENLSLMEKLKETFNFLSEEPLTISIKKEESSKEELFARILRIRVWGLKNKNFSWNVYSKDRELVHDLIVRRVVWNFDKDAKMLKKNRDENQIVLSEHFPSADIRNIYIPSTQTKKVIRLINQLDAEIGEGFILKKKRRTKGKWSESEILRLYDWGQIHCRWGADRKNKDVHKKIEKLVLELDKIMEKSGVNIYEMILNYHSEEPEKYSSENLLKIWEAQNGKG